MDVLGSKLNCSLQVVGIINGDSFYLVLERVLERNGFGIGFSEGESEWMAVRSLGLSVRVCGFRELISAMVMETMAGSAICTRLDTACLNTRLF
jgi:hypothetical protein